MNIVDYDDEKKYEKVSALFRNEMNFSAAESYKVIRTNLIFTLRSKGCKRIIITSSLPGEGKTSNCCNLGITLAQAGLKVLIIDCDLRKPELHKYFRKKSIPGLSDVLADFSTVDKAINDSGYNNLDLIFGGTVPPNPAELLGSNAMDDLLRSISKEYDYILFDTPPVNVVADTTVLTSKSDGVVIIVKEGVTTHPNLKRTVTSLEFAQARILGFILNGVSRHPKYKYGEYGKKTEKYSFDKYKYMVKRIVRRVMND